MFPLADLLLMYAEHELKGGGVALPRGPSIIRGGGVALPRGPSIIRKSKGTPTSHAHHPHMDFASRFPPRQEHTGDIDFASRFPPRHAGHNQPKSQNSTAFCFKMNEQGVLENILGTLISLRDFRRGMRGITLHSAPYSAL